MGSKRCHFSPRLSMFWVICPPIVAQFRWETVIRGSVSVENSHWGLSFGGNWQVEWTLEELRATVKPGYAYTPSDKPYILRSTLLPFDTHITRSHVVRWPHLPVKRWV